MKFTAGKLWFKIYSMFLDSEHPSIVIYYSFKFTFQVFVMLFLYFAALLMWFVLVKLHRIPYFKMLVIVDILVVQ